MSASGIFECCRRAIYGIDLATSARKRHGILTFSAAQIEDSVCWADTILGYETLDQ